MADRTNEDKLDTALSMISAIEESLLSLYAKKHSSTSYGDQSITNASIVDLEKSRDRWRREVEALKASINRNRPTLKIQFR